MTEKRDVPFGRPWITDEDRKAVLEVLDGYILTHGPQSKAFEAEFSAFMGPGAHSVSVSSGMAALHLAYLHYGIGKGDEVIVPAQTHSATAHAVEWVGATPVFVDCEPKTGNVTADILKAAITPRTKALSVVHFDGIPCNMPEIVALAEPRGIKVIEDCALAVGGRWDGTHVGLFGDVGCFSFYPVKHFTTAEGGMFVSRHRDVADTVARLRAHGVDRTHLERTIPGMYDVVAAGLNYRLSEIQAALGRTQLRRIDTILEMREANFTKLKGAIAPLPGVRVIDAVDPRARNSFYCMTVVFEGALGPRRNDIVARLNADGVGTSVYYPQPVPRMTYYRTKYGYQPERFRHAAEISDHSVALPVGPHLSEADVRYVADTLTRIVKELAR
jgi:dTDP-4-amino-4,6-dideoxygalactose transaminase